MTDAPEGRMWYSSFRRVTVRPARIRRATLLLPSRKGRTILKSRKTITPDTLAAELTDARQAYEERRSQIITTAVERQNAAVEAVADLNADIRALSAVIEQAKL